MTLTEWLVGGIENPFKAGQWKPLHISTLLISIGLVVGFYFIVKFQKNKERAKNTILISLALSILFFEITSRILYFIKLYVLAQPEMNGLGMLWIILPKPWCAVACWAIMASVIVRKEFFYDFACLSALLCSVIFFAYPGVGFNNVHLLFFNWYSILTHALLLTTSLTMIVLKIATFKYKNFWKYAVCLGATFVYGLIEIFVLNGKISPVLDIKTPDPMYFMPGGDIQADILKIPYALYLAGYIFLIVVYVNAFYLISDRKNVKQYFSKIFSRKRKDTI